MPEVGLPKEELKPYMWQRFLPWILDEVNTVEKDTGRPLLSAVVVSQDSGLPGDGFFFSLTVGRLLEPEEATEEQKRAVHERELQRVYSAWAE
ncbi:MAG: hypothetical protein OXH77_00710 [Anaerolineaceae bacterium]|nr:hypothetical protein [Anaerolineaceae bacterium]